MDRAVAEVTKALLDLAAPQPGERALDIGCGSSTTVLEPAARVGPAGYVLGADIADHSVARARERIATAGLQHAEAIVADAYAPNREFIKRGIRDSELARLRVDEPERLADCGQHELLRARPGHPNLWHIEWE